MERRGKGTSERMERRGLGTSVRIERKEKGISKNGKKTLDTSERMENMQKG